LKVTTVVAQVAAQSGLFNQNGQTEVEMAIVLAKNNLMTTPIVDPKEIDPVGRNVHRATQTIS